MPSWYTLICVVRFYIFEIPICDILTDEPRQGKRPCYKKGTGSPYSITERRVPELIPVLGSQPAGDVTHKPGSRLPLLSTRPAVTPATLKRAATNFRCLVNKGTMGVNSLPKTVTRQHRGCDLNPGPSTPESSTLTTPLLSHPLTALWRWLFDFCGYSGDGLLLSKCP